MDYTGLELYNPENLAHMREVAKEIYSAGVGKPWLKNPSTILFILQRAKDLGVSPLAGLEGIFPISRKDRDGASTHTWGIKVDLARGLVRKMGGDFKVLAEDSMSCQMEFTRMGPFGDIKHTETLTRNEVIAAGLPDKQSFKQFPRQILRATCFRRGAQLLFSDVLLGLVPVDEADARESAFDEALVDSPGEEVVGLNLPGDQGASSGMVTPNAETQTSEFRPKHPGGRPKGSRNRSKEPTPSAGADVQSVSQKDPRDSLNSANESSPAEASAIPAESSAGSAPTSEAQPIPPPEYTSPVSPVSPVKEEMVWDEIRSCYIPKAEAGSIKEAALPAVEPGRPETQKTQEPCPPKEEKLTSVPEQVTPSVSSAPPADFDLTTQTCEAITHPVEVVPFSKTNPDHKKLFVAAMTKWIAPGTKKTTVREAWGKWMEKHDVKANLESVLRSFEQCCQDTGSQLAK